MLAWQTGAERYFRTYGIQQEVEKVTIGADLFKREAVTWWNGLWITGREAEIRSWAQLLEKLRERFLPPEGESKYIGSWRKLQQTGSVAAYADYVFRLETLCPMGMPASFKLAYFGLFPELQAEVRKHLRQYSKKVLLLEEFFAVAADAEVGLRIRKDGKKGREEGVEKGKKLAVVQRSGSIKGSKGSNQQSTHEALLGRQSLDPTNEVKKAREACWICDGFRHGWFHCPKKKPGRGCARCGSLGHRLFSCPQRPQYSISKESTSLAHQAIAGLETEVLQVDGAPKEASILRYPIKINNIQTQIVLDSGATVNAIEASFFNRIGGSISQPARGPLYYADGREAKVLGLARIEVKGKGYREKLIF